MLYMVETWYTSVRVGISRPGSGANHTHFVLPRPGSVKKLKVRPAPRPEQKFYWPGIKAEPGPYNFFWPVIKRFWYKKKKIRPVQTFFGPALKPLPKPRPGIKEKISARAQSVQISFGPIRYKRKNFAPSEPGKHFLTCPGINLNT